MENKMITDDELLDDKTMQIIKTAGFSFGVSGIDAILLDEAKRATARAQRGFKKGDFSYEAGATAAAILCSSAACEARLSEYLAHYEFASGTLPEDLERIRQNRDALEQWRLLFRSEKPEFNCGTCSEYAALGCLFRLRDLVAHRGARLVPLDSFPERIQDCVRQGILPVRKSSAKDWTRVIFVHEVAKWASETATTWLRIVDEIFPFTH
jgi:hypothetical protein